MADNMEIDMEVDILVDEEEDEELAQLRAQAEAAQVSAQADMDTNPAELDNGLEDGEVEARPDDRIMNKLHLVGVDSLTTKDIERYVSDYRSLDRFTRVEWVNDTSCNLIFKDQQAAQFMYHSIAIMPPTEKNALCKGRTLLTHPEAELYVRWATGLDVKQAGAKDVSRFYLLNPEHDPDNRKRQRRTDEGGRHGKRARVDVDYAPFDVNLYDDDGGEKARAKSEAKEARARPRRTEDLFAKKADGRLRDRSASPVSDGDGRFGFAEEQPYRRTARHRSTTPERFSGRAKPQNGQGTNAGKELFPDRQDPHKRTDAQDLHPNYVADIIDRPPKRDLFSRVTGGPPSSFPPKRSGILSEDTNDTEGFQILGASKVESPLVRELFPMKMQQKNGGKDLFDGKIKGASQRRRAEDLF